MTDVVLLPAFPVTSAVWAGPAAALTAAGHRVLTPDQRGFGGTPLGPDEPSLDLVADDVARLLDSEGLPRAVVGGVSMGGYVAMALLRRHPDRVAALALVDTKATADPPAARDNRERIARTVLAESSPRVLLDDVLPALLGPTTKAERPAVLAA
ncbi:MAG TPA: alpha/beta fold hydrolase, partial [Mycobacteriales bacterium]|nr:alpha/beta fold hydrolase [Mycobacteriales bacterium]